MKDARVALRMIIVQVVFVLAFGFLGLKLWSLQIGRSEAYSSLADKNLYRLVSINPPRGVIYDRTGEILVRNIPSFSLAVVPAALPDDEQVLDAMYRRLAILLGISANKDVSAPATTAYAGAIRWGTKLFDKSVADLIMGVQQGVKLGKLPIHSPTVLISELPRDIAFTIEEEHLDLPGITIEITPQREYLYDSLLAHWLGYVGPISESMLKAYRAQGDPDRQEYVASDQVGLTGVELTYEQELHGRKGQKHIEVDAFEREMRVLATEPAQPGNSLVLTLDLELQKVAEQALRERMEKVKASSGSVIAMNPQTGEILAMVSLPSFDNNLFSGGISVEDYTRLINDPLSPLLNHAIGGEYPPGSTFKIVMANAGLEEKVISPNTEFVCQGTLLLPNEFMPDDLSKAQKFYCWVPEGHGRVNLASALAYSCDIYFYQVGGGFKNFIGLGLDRLTRYARQFGFGEATGIKLPGETAGLVPTERWKRKNWDANWVTGDTYNISIGQGYFLATPLQMLNATAAIANGGTLYRPQVVSRVVDAEGHTISQLQPEVIQRLSVSAENIQLVRQGMRAAATWGTSGALDQELPSIRAAGKTGTAEFPGERDKEGHLPTHAWFAAFAPFEKPEIALVVFIAGGGQGALEAVPVASQVLRQYFHVPLPPSQSSEKGQ
jgi:penicillin-binding protein 2